MAESTLSSTNNVEAIRQRPLDNEENVPNFTLQSTGSNRIILIKPESSDLIRNPLEISKCLKSSFSGHDIKDIRTNKRKNLIIVETVAPIKNPNSLLKISMLGKWKVECSFPKIEMEVYGVIFPISYDIDLDELKKEISIPNHNILSDHDDQVVVTKIERLKKKVDGEWVQSHSIKLAFNTKIMPKAVTICHSYYRVRPYVGLPLQCFNCQRLGHTAESCKSKKRCLLCGGNHDKKECLINTSTDFKCANCGWAHKANSRECLIFGTAQRIEKVRAETGKPYVEARKDVLNKQYSNSDNENVRSYSSTLKGSNIMVTNSIQTKNVNPGTSLDLVQEPVDMPIAFNENDFLLKLKSCLTLILENVLPDGVVPNLEETIDNAIKQKFPTFLSGNKENRGLVRHRSTSSSSNTLTDASLDESPASRRSLCDIDKSVTGSQSNVASFEKKLSKKQKKEMTKKMKQ